MMKKKVPKSRMMKKKKARRKLSNLKTIVNHKHLMIQTRINNRLISNLKKNKIFNRNKINWQRKTKLRVKATGISGKIWT